MAKVGKDLDDTEAIAILQAIARDPSIKAYERLQALTQLERRQKGTIGQRRAKVDAELEDESMPADPMDDLDELAVRRARKRGG